MSDATDWLRRINAGEKITKPDDVPPTFGEAVKRVDDAARAGNGEIEKPAPWRSCYTCRDYAQHRIDVITQPLADKAEREDRDAAEVVEEYMAAAHARHLAGDPLREGGPTRVTDPTLGRLAALLSPGLFGPTKETA